MMEFIRHGANDIIFARSILTSYGSGRSQYGSQDRLVGSLFLRFYQGN